MVTLSWLQIIADISVGLGILSIIIITVDILRGNRQQIKIMNLVWPITAFYMPLFGLWAYKKMSMTKQKHKAMQKSGHARPFWQKCLFQLVIVVQAALTVI